MKYIVTLNGKDYEVDVNELDEAVVRSVKESQPMQAAAPTVPVTESVKSAVEGSGTPVKSPMPGTILKITASVGHKVNEGDVVIILESMKMENEIVAPVSGVISKIAVQTGDSVATDDVLAFIG